METSVGRKIRELRQERGLSQDELAYWIDVTRQTVNKWERGRMQPTTDNIKALCDYFGVTADELLNNITAEAVPASAKAETLAAVPEPDAAVRRAEMLWRIAKKILIIGIVISAVTFVISFVAFLIWQYGDACTDNEGIFETIELVYDDTMGRIILGIACGSLISTCIFILLFVIVSLKIKKLLKQL